LILPHVGLFLPVDFSKLENFKKIQYLYGEKNKQINKINNLKKIRKTTKMKSSYLLLAALLILMTISNVYAAEE